MGSSKECFCAIFFPMKTRKYTLYFFFCIIAIVHSLVITNLINAKGELTLINFARFTSDFEGSLKI